MAEFNTEADLNTGAIIFAIMFQQLQPKIGFGWAIRCIGFVVLASLAFPLVTMRKLFTQSPPRALIDKSALKEWPFILTLPAMFLVFLGLYCPYFCEVPHSVSETFADLPPFASRYRGFLRADACCEPRDHPIPHRLHECGLSVRETGMYG